MRSSSALARRVAASLILAAASLCASRAEAQQQPLGFGVERLHTSAPGGGWFVMDTLDMRGGLGGGAGLTLSYARNPLRLRTSDGAEHLALVSDQAFAGFGFAATYDRYRLHLDLAMPLAVTGDGGTLGAYRYTAPSVDPGYNPDLLSDARVGFDARLLGDATSRFRLGAGVQLFAPNGRRQDYVTDGSYRAMGRLLVAGDVGRFTYAGHLGVHVRPLDDSPTPGSPQGSELLFGVAAGGRFPVGSGVTALVVGPEVFGATALRSALTTQGTALESLLTARIEGTADRGAQVRVRLGAGPGLVPHLGAPEWRVVFGIEVFDHAMKESNAAH
jgi:hypothetical protein